MADCMTRYVMPGRVDGLVIIIGEGLGSSGRGLAHLGVCDGDDGEKGSHEERPCSLRHLTRVSKVSASLCDVLA